MNKWTPFLLIFSMLFSAQVYAAGNVNRYECYPSANEHPEWPIGAIYLHGLFYARGADGNAWRSLEFQQRKKILALARKMKIRIAIPLAPVDKRGRRNWQNVALSTVEASARRACGGKPLARKRSLIGFSAGGYEARKIAAMRCDQRSAYKDILIIGAPPFRNSPGVRSCRGTRNYVNNVHGILDVASISNHVAPGENEDGRRQYARDEESASDAGR